MTSEKPNQWFQQAFDSHYKEMVLYAQRYLNDLSASEDIVQEIFIQLWENRASISIHTSIRSYLYSMVRNKCLNFLKALKITDNLDVLKNLNHSESENLEDNAAIVSKKLEEVKKVIYVMPLSMREIFELKYLSNLTCTEIATELNISPNTVKTQLKRAKARILQVRNFPLIFLYIFYL